MTTSIRQADLIESVAAALQYISYYHPVDYIKNLAAAYEREESPAAKDAIAQILINSRMCAEGHRPICQDTGIVTVFLEIGMDVRWDDATMGVEDMVASSQRTPMPISRKIVTMPVSWQIGRWPSAHMRELVRICAIASLAAVLCSRS